MALARMLNTDKRTSDLCYENSELTKEVERLEDALNYYQRRTEAPNSPRSLIRREIGGSHWQYGASGKLRDFRSASDLRDEPSHKNESSKTELSKNASKARNSTGATQTEPKQEHKRLSEPLKCMKTKRKSEGVSVKPMTVSDLEKSEHLTTTRLASGRETANAMSQKQTPKSCDPQVQRWLEGLNLKDTNRYVSIFADNEFDTLGLKMLGDVQLKEMGITALGARNKILQGVKLLNGEDIVSKDLTVEPVKKKTKPKVKKETKKNDDLDTIPVREPKSTRTVKAPPIQRVASAGTKASGRLNSGRQTVTSSRPSTARTGPKPKKPGQSATSKTAESKPKELKRTIERAAAPHDSPVLEYEEPQTAISTYDQSPCEARDKIISSLSAQVQKLLESNQDGDSKTVDMIVQLQEQISAIRLQMNQKDLPPEPQNQTELKINVENPGDTKEPKPVSPNAKSLNDLTKITLLDGVRNQKNAYAKQIRHLELELERMRGVDQQSCELPMEDLYYSDEDLVGEGVFSRVYRGQFQGVEVAIKRLKSPLSKHDKNYFGAEVSLLRELRHPRVVLLLGVTSGTHLPCMVFEWMGAGSLHNMLHAPYTPALDHVAYYQVAKDMAQGMNYLHRHKPSVLHLDLKSRNVLLNVYGRAKIGDFGFSKLRHEASINASSRARQAGPSGAASGALSWMAPELLSAKPVTVKADVFSYGMILWEMLTRREPYEGLSTYKVIEMVRHSERPRIPDSTPPRLAMLIDQCWDQNQAKRPQFKDILLILDDLELPPEWRYLLEKADIPQVFLQNLQSARQIIDYVNMTLDSMETGSLAESLRVPHLDLTIDDFTDEEFLEVLDSARDSVRSDRGKATKRHSVKFESLDFKLKDAEYGSEGFQVSESEKLTSSTDEAAEMMMEIAGVMQGSELRVIDLETEESEERKSDRRLSEEGFHQKDRRGSRIRVLPPGPPKKRPSSDFTTDSENKVPEAPPPPPIGAPKAQPLVLSVSVIPPPPPPPPIMSPGKTPPKLQLPKKQESTESRQQIRKPVGSSTNPMVTSARLLEQKTVLRSSLTPHPAQLRSLRTVPKQRLSNVAEVLKEALDCRRLAMMRESITARSDDYLSEPDEWLSRRCSLAPTYRSELDRLSDRTGGKSSRRSSRLDVKRGSLRLSDDDDMTRRILIQQALEKLRKDEVRRASMATMVTESWGSDAVSQSTPRLEVQKSSRSRSLTPTMVARLSGEARAVSPNRGTKKE